MELLAIHTAQGPSNGFGALAAWYSLLDPKWAAQSCTTKAATQELIKARTISNAPFHSDDQVGIAKALLWQFGICSPSPGDAFFD